MSVWSHGWVCDIFYLFITSSTKSKKLQDEGETTTATLSLATHFPDVLSKLTEASGSIVTSQTQYMATCKLYNYRSWFWF